MKATTILAHPYTKSFNHAIFETVNNTLLELRVENYAHDLYQEQFNPVLTVEELGKQNSTDSLVNQYIDELLDSDLVIFVHPNWWGMPPAILKGYIDRVIRPPHAYDFPETDSGGGLPIGKLKGKVGVVFNTSNTEENRENDYFTDPLAKIWEKCVFGFCGIEKSHRRIFRIVADSTLEERQKWLQCVEQDIVEIVKDIKITVR